MNKREALKAYKLGDYESLLKNARVYGVIVYDRRWHIEAPARYAGAWRALWINWHGLGWHFEMHNGQIVEFGHRFAPVIIGIHGRAVTEEENARDIRIRDGITQ